MSRTLPGQFVGIVAVIAITASVIARPPVEPPASIADRIGSPAAVPADAGLSLAEAMERVFPGESVPPARPVTRAEPAPRGVMKYASAYTRFLEGNFAGARSDALEALEIDPESIESLLLLGRIESRLGRALSAKRYYEQVRELDPTRAQAALALSDDALRLGNADEALAMIGPWMRDDIGEAWIRPIVMDRVARAMAARGYLDAAVEAARRVEPPRGPVPEWGVAYLGEALRSRGSLWMMLGDLALSAGDADRALALYEEAASGSEPVAWLDTHRVYALVVAGRTDAAIGVVTERLEITRGADIETRSLVRYLAEQGADRERLAAAIAAVARSVNRDADPAGASLLRLAAMTREAPASIDMLERQVREHPSDEASMAMLMRVSASEAGAEDAWSRGVALATASPWQAESIAWALIESVRDRDALVRLSVDESSPASALLSGLVQWRLGRERAARGLLDSCAHAPELDGAGIAPAARLRHLLGSLSDAMAIIDGADATSGIGVRRGVAEALGALTMRDRALEVLTPALATDPDAGALHLAGRLCRDRGEFGRAADYFERAWRADPYQHRSAAALLGIIAPGGDALDEVRAARVVREMRRVDPASPVLGWFRVQALLAGDEPEMATQELRLLLEEHPIEEAFIVALADVLASTGRADEAEAWVESNVDRMPGSGALRLALARVRMRMGEYDLAATALEDWIKRFPGDFEALKLLETINADFLTLRLTAEEFKQRRIDLMPRTVETVLEDLALRVSKKRLDEAGELLEELAGVVPEGSAAVSVQLRAIAEELMLRTAMNQAQIQQAIGLLREMRTRFAVASSPELLGLELMLSARGVQTDEELLDLAKRSEHTRLLPPGEATVRLAEAIRDPGRPFQNRREFDDRRMRSLRFLQKASMEGTSLAPARVHAEWLHAAMDMQDFAGLGDALELALDRGTLGDALNYLSESGRVAPFGRNWEAAMRWSVGAMNELQRERAADAAYEGVLHFSPDDPGACNDLGYRLLERGEQVGRAIALIETAYRQNPDDAATADSMGWARYMQGRIKDEIDAVTGERTLGAISYLERSLDLIGDATDSGSVFNIVVAKSHLGDAYWAIGDREMARAMWDECARLSEKLLATVQREDLNPLGEELLGIMETSRANVGALDAGQTPVVTPIIGAEDPDTISPSNGANGEPARGRT